MSLPSEKYVKLNLMLTFPFVIFQVVQPVAFGFASNSSDLPCLKVRPESYKQCVK